MGWQVASSSSFNPHDDSALCDYQVETAWVAGGETPGIGEFVILRFPKSKFPRGRETIPLDGFLLLGGFQKDESTWKAYARPRRLRVTLNNSVLFELGLEDNRVAQTFRFDPVNLRPGDELTFEVLEVYPGNDGFPVALSALEPLGAH
ncbi:MAG: hypothetical protein GY906_32530 [bacterium]|nr:hypothetical protein [bacterium]